MLSQLVWKPESPCDSWMGSCRLYNLPCHRMQCESCQGASLLPRTLLRILPWDLRQKQIHLVCLSFHQCSMSPEPSSRFDGPCMLNLLPYHLAQAVLQGFLLDLFR